MWNIAKVLQLLKLPDGTIKVLVEGLQRANIKNYIIIKILQV
jgi:ATP-dependent Lon protease